MTGEDADEEDAGFGAKMSAKGRLLAENSWRCDDWADWPRHVTWPHTRRLPKPAPVFSEKLISTRTSQQQ